MREEPINDTACRCGKKWGEHHYPSQDVIDVKLFCVSCGDKIRGQCLERYKISGNYCGGCSGKLDVNYQYSHNK